MRPAQAGSNARIVGKHYEVDSVSGSQTKRYYAGGQLLATRTGTTLRYIQPDHLGSTTTLTDEWGQVVSRERYAAFGERRRTSDTLTTDQLYTGQRLNVLSGLYHYSDGSSAGRFYDPLLARFVQADTVTPGNTSIALNRYAYANNSPLVFSDPSGHDAMLVGGWGSNDWEDPSGWQEWAMAYKGWTEEQWQSEFYKPWRNAQDAGDNAAKQAIMERTGIHIFDWTACGCGNGDSISSSRWATHDWALTALDQQMQGMEDITLIGHSKGGNLVYNYISAEGHAYPIKNAVIIAAPLDSGLSFLPIVGRPGLPWLNDSAKQSTVVVMNHVYDILTGGPSQGIVGARNHVDLSLTRDPHAFHRNMHVAELTLLRYFSVIGDRHARTR